LKSNVSLDNGLLPFSWYPPGGRGRRAASLASACLLAWLGAGTGFAAGLAATAPPAVETSADAPPLRVGVRVMPPFVIRKEEGRKEEGGYEGITVAVWEHIAADLHLRYQWKELNPGETAGAITRHEIDLAIGNLIVTPEQQKSMDFSQPYYVSRLAIAVPNDADGSAFLVRLPLPAYPGLFAGAICLMTIAGTVIWLSERKRNPGHFGGGIAGLLNGVWWAIVTMTGVGYGDMTPVTAFGRLFATLWMFAGIILVALFTADVTATLTAYRFSLGISSVSDLSRVSVAAIHGAPAEAYLRDLGIMPRPVANVRDGLRKLAAHEVTAFVGDEPILRSLVRDEFAASLHVLDVAFGRDDHAIALPVESRLRRPLDQSLLTFIASPEWQQVLKRYIGRAE
jgi:polar amino acid transport system substrate-binding protein